MWSTKIQQLLRLVDTGRIVKCSLTRTSSICSLPAETPTSFWTLNILSGLIWLTECTRGLWALTGTMRAGWATAAERIQPSVSGSVAQKHHTCNREFWLSARWNTSQMFEDWGANALAVTPPTTPPRVCLVTSDAFLISGRAAGIRVRSFHPYLSQRHKRTEIGISGDWRNVEEIIVFKKRIGAFLYKQKS